MAINKKDFYNGNPAIKKAGVKQGYTPDQMLEYKKCKNDVIYFIENYCIINTIDKGKVLFKPYDYQKRMIKAFDDNRFVINLLPRQTGKGYKLDTKLPTPTGWTTIEDVQVGDEILGKDGNSTKVQFKSELHNIENYIVKFDDGSIHHVDKSHLFTVSHSDWSHNEKVMNVVDIKNKVDSGCSSRVYINHNDGLKLTSKTLAIDPYTLGVWLGDGDSNSSRIFGEANDLSEIMKYIPYDKNPVKVTKSCNTQSIKLPWNILDKQKLKHNKHIPIDYLRGDENQRLELLKGLMDTDGYTSKVSGACEFYQKSKVLLNNVQELLSSLGIKNRIRFKIVNGEEYGTISFSTSHDVFKLSRKLKQQQTKRKNHVKNKRIYIKSIELVDSVTTQCIQVDNQDKLFLVGQSMIPSHNTTIVSAYLLHYTIFNADKEVGILANKAMTAREILDRIKLMLENIPFWMQSGVKEYNKGNVEFGNNSKLLAFATSSDAVRGRSFSMIYLDEFAFVDNAEMFYTSTYPVISSGDTSKVIITSTPHGMNLFYRLWIEATQGKNSYFPVEVKWDEHPDRDVAWRKVQEENIGKKRFMQEFACSFYGSSGTLIDGETLAGMAWKEPIVETDKLIVYANPIEGHNYVLCVDVSEGAGSDFSVINIIDISVEPYQQVALYRDNKTTPLVLPEIIERMAIEYNEGFVLIETNSIGSQVATSLYYDNEYENMIISTVKNQENVISGGFGGRIDFGIRMTKRSKQIGCSNIKTLIENQILEINDFNTIEEFQTFSKKGASYEAEVGKFDDVVMTFVAFGWLSSQDYFKDLFDFDAREVILANKMKQIEADLTPAGFHHDPVAEAEYGLDYDDQSSSSYSSVFNGS